MRCSTSVLISHQNCDYRGGSSGRGGRGGEAGEEAEGLNLDNSEWRLNVQKSVKEEQEEEAIVTLIPVKEHGREEEQGAGFLRQV